MNDRHPSGDYPHPPTPDAGHASYTSYDQQSVQYGGGYPSHDGYDGYDAYGAGSVATATAAFPAQAGYAADQAMTSDYVTGSYPVHGFAQDSYAVDYDTDPLFGDLPGTAPTGHAPATDPSLGPGSWDTGGYATAASHDPYGNAQQVDPYAGYDTGGYATVGHPDGQDTGGSWDTGAWTALDGTGAGWSPDPYAAPSYATDGQATAYDPLGLQTTGPEGYEQDPHGHPQDGVVHAAQDHETQHLAYGTACEADPLSTPAYDTTPFDATGLSGAAHEQQPAAAWDGPESGPYGHIEPELVDYERELADIDATGFDTPGDPDQDPYADADPYAEAVSAGQTARGHGSVEDGFPDAAPGDPADEDGCPSENRTEDTKGRRAVAAPRGGPGRGTGSRRRAPAKRSALLTVAVPSACVIGVAGVAAASMASSDDDKRTTTASSSEDVEPSEANNKLDTQLDNLSADTRDFAGRASRTQERIDLEAKQEAERKKAAEEAARKERERPKFALPVAQHGLSAYFGQAGVNWMSVHTGIDFPVSYGTPVMAATDGTVRFQYNAAYGNMAIVTAKDGTETWYCHLSSYAVGGGATVKAGDTIAFSGSSGNSTGPHLHFEVRPNGGSAIDPLSWLRSHGIEPN